MYPKYVCIPIPLQPSCSRLRKAVSHCGRREEVSVELQTRAHAFEVGTCRHCTCLHLSESLAGDLTRRIPCLQKYSHRHQHHSLTPCFFLCCSHIAAVTPTGSLKDTGSVRAFTGRKMRSALRTTGVVQTKRLFRDHSSRGTAPLSALANIKGARCASRLASRTGAVWQHETRRPRGTSRVPAGARPFSTPSTTKPVFSNGEAPSFAFAFE